MSKFFRLCSCELTKILKKKSTKVMLILLIISLFASVGITVLTKKAYNLEEYYTGSNYKEQINLDIESLKAELSNEDLDQASRNQLQAELDINQIALDNDINTYQTYWKSEVLWDDIQNDKCSWYNYKSLGDEESANALQSQIDKKIELIKNDDFNAYINIQREELKSKLDNGSIDEDEYNDEKYIIDLKEKYEIGKVYNQDDNWKTTILAEIQTLQQNIKTGVDQITQKVLTEEGLKKAEDNIKLNEYRLEHNYPPFSTTNSIGTERKTYDYMMSSFTMFILAIMMIVIAGSTISSEISKGTIKFWSFTPNKRWKILLSKLLVNVVILVVTTVGITLISTVVGNIFFGAENAQPYLYVKAGSVHTINYIIFAILYNLVIAIDIFVFILLAMMLSTVVRNTAVAVGVSIAAYMGGSTIMQIVNLFVKSEWIKFVPFNNLGLQDKIFTNDVSYTVTTMTNSIISNVSVKFSLAVLGVCAVIMIVTMFDSFRKRDL